jgi:glycosyltransferase involved in cell wall biosynthesis
VGHSNEEGAVTYGSSTEGTRAPLISVLTPTWDRAAYLKRVWKGLCSQSFKDFEWVIADDGSADATQAALQDMADHSEFPVVVITASVHIGKPRMDNELMAHARGKFVIWNDSDDYLVPDALEKLLQAWRSIPASAAHEYIGVTALCIGEDGRIQSNLIPFSDTSDTTWNELREVHRVTGDMTFFVRAEIIRGEKFMEVDFMITESSFWKAFSDFKTRFLPVPVKVMSRDAPNRISFVPRMEYCRGKAYGLVLSERLASPFKQSLSRRAWLAITYWRYCVHGEVAFREAVDLWQGKMHRLLYFPLLPVGFLFALKDQLQRKVRKTHRDFEAARARVAIGVRLLNGHNHP